MEIKGFYKGNAVTADFEMNTITIEIEGEFSVRAGVYFVITEEAMTEFVDRICKKQRENCIESIPD